MITNDVFFDEILDSTINASKTENDTSELFLRTIKLLELDSRKEKITPVLGKSEKKFISNNKKATKLYKELKTLLPGLIRWIDNIKFNEGYKKVSHRGQSAESKVFVEVYKNLPEEIFALIIHDCILTTEDKTQMVKDRLVERVRELYKDVIPNKLNINKLFKTSKVSEVRWVNYNK